MADRPALLPAKLQQLEVVRAVSGSGDFDADAWHVMDKRDNALIEDEILHGSGSSKFVYSFKVSGKQVSGISVVGARQLAFHYQGIKHRLISSVQKIGTLHTFTSYPQPGMPMAVTAAVIPELEDEADYYSVLIEIDDIKTGNSIQVEKRETRMERRQDDSLYERPNYQTIAQSKAYRNGILSLIPQDVQLRWKIEMLKLNKDDEITDSVLDEKRAGVLKYAAQKAISLQRDAVYGLTLDQIAGLSDAARAGNAPAFAQSCLALGIADGEVQQGAAADRGGEKQTVAATPKPAAKPRAGKAANAGPDDRGGDPGAQDEHGGKDTQREPEPSHTPSPTAAVTHTQTHTQTPTSKAPGTTQGSLAWPEDE